MTPEDKIRAIDERLNQLGYKPSSPEEDLQRIDKRLAELGVNPVQVQTNLPQESALETYVRTNKNLNKALARGIIGLPDLFAAGKISKKLQELGIDLSPQEGSVDTSPLGKVAKSAEKIASHGVEWIGAGLGGMGLGNVAARALPYAAKAIPSALKSIPYVSNPLSKVASALPTVLGKPENLTQAAQMTGLAGGLGALSGAAQEAGMGGLEADIGAALLPTSVAIARATPRLIKKGYKTFTNLPEYYERMGQARLADIVGQENVPALLEAIEGYKPPIEGYLPTTAEATGDLALAAQERAKMGAVPELLKRYGEGNKAVYEELKGIAPTSAGMPAVQEHLSELGEGLKETRGRYSQYQKQRAEKALEDIGKRTTPETAGSELRGKLASNVAEREALREEATRPLYEKLEKSKEEILPSHTINYIDRELKTAKGDIRKSLLSIKKELEPNLKSVSQEEDAYRKLLKKDPEMAKVVYPGGIKKEETLKPIELKKVTDFLNDKIESAKIAGNRNQSRVLSHVKDNLLKDLEVVPAEKEARALYHELSKPISRITEHKKMGPAVKKDIFEKDYLMRNSEVAPHLVDDALKSPERGRELLTELGNDRKSLEEYVNYTLTKDITDASGKVIPSKIDTWKKNNPNYKEIYPNLDKKLNNLHAAQVMATDTIKRSEKAIDHYYKNTAATFLNKSPEKVISSTLQTSNPPQKFKEIKGLLKGNEVADEGLQRSFVDHLTKNITTAKVDVNDLNRLSYPKLREYLSDYRSSLEEVLSPTQMNSIDKIESVLKGRHKVTAAETNNSATVANYTVLQLGKDLTEDELKKLIGKSSLKGRIATGAMNFFKKVRESGTDRVINNAIVNPDYFKLLMTKPFSSAEQATTFTKRLNKSYLIPTALSSYAEEGEEE